RLRDREGGGVADQRRSREGQFGSDGIGRSGGIKAVLATGRDSQIDAIRRGEGDVGPIYRDLTHVRYGYGNFFRRRTLARIIRGGSSDFEVVGPCGDRAAGIHAGSHLRG